MAIAEDKTSSELINVLYKEVHENYGEVCNFTSFLRTACTIYLARKSSIGDVDLSEPTESNPSYVMAYNK
jgi:predicted DNA-binding ribbon-helix-helix protein